MATSTKSPVRYVGVVEPGNARHARGIVRRPEPGPGEVLIVRGRSQTGIYHACGNCAKLREFARPIRLGVALFRAMTLCELCAEKRCCADHREPQKTLDQYAQPHGEVVA